MVAAGALEAGGVVEVVVPPQPVRKDKETKTRTKKRVMTMVRNLGVFIIFLLI